MGLFDASRPASDSVLLGLLASGALGPIHAQITLESPRWLNQTESVKAIFWCSSLLEVVVRR